MSLFTNSYAKMTKIQSSLLDLNREISTAAKFLQQLRQHSIKIVKNLNSITSHPVYLKQYIQVNSFLLKYLSILTEINCKFEIMQLLEATARNDQNKKLEKTNFDVEQLEGMEESSRHVETVVKSVEKPHRGSFFSGGTNSEVEVPEKNEEETQVNTVSKTFTNLSLKNDDCRLNSCTEKTLVPDGDDIQTLEDNGNLIQKASADSQQKSDCKSVEDDAVSETNSVATYDASRPSSIEFLPMLQSTLTEEHLQGSRSIIARSKQKEKPLECIENFEIKSLNIPHKLGDKFKVAVQYIKSPSEFYVHVLNEELEMLNDLEKKLKFYAVENQGKQSKNDKKIMSKEIGALALYYSKCDEVWYRARVCNWCIGYNDDLVNIFLIDYGEYKCISIDTLQPMPDYFKKYPSFAIRCHLHKVFPVDDVERRKSLIWSKGSSEEMKRIVENSSEFLIKIAPKDPYHPSNSWPVVLFITGETEECLNKLLVKNNFAVDNPGDEKVDSTNNSPAVSCNSLENWNPMKEDYESYQNNYELDMQDPAAAIYGYVGKDYERICPQYRKTGRCYKGDACRKEHGPFDPLGYTTDQEEVYKSAFNPLPSPELYETFKVLVTCILGVNQFCCIRDHTNWDEEEETLSSLIKFMNDPKNVREMKKLLVPPSAGQIVIGQFSEDQCWYRAKILESQPEHDTYTLVFVDYGNKETLTLSKIRAIEPRYLHLPFQMIQCFVFGIERNPNATSKDIVDYMNGKMGEGHVNVEVVSKFPGDDVTLLVNVFDKNGENLAEDLIAKGYAVCKKEIVLSGENEALPG